MKGLIALILGGLISANVFADLENFYGTFGLRNHLGEDELATNGLSFNYGPTWSFGLGYKFEPIKIFSTIDFSSINVSDSFGDSVDFSARSLIVGAGYDHQLSDNLYASFGGEYSINSDIDNDYDYSTYENENTFAFFVSFGISNKTEYGPIGVWAGYAAGHDPFYTEETVNETRIHVEYPGLIGMFVFAGAGAYAASSGGGGYGSSGYSWDQFYDQYGNLTWRCRSRASGRFAADYNCAGQVQIDSAWPGK